LKVVIQRSRIDSHPEWIRNERVWINNVHAVIRAVRYQKILIYRIKHDTRRQLKTRNPGDKRTAVSVQQIHGARRRGRSHRGKVSCSDYAGDARNVLNGSQRQRVWKLIYGDRSSGGSLCTGSRQRNEAHVTLRGITCAGIGIRNTRSGRIGISSYTCRFKTHVAKRYRGGGRESSVASS